MHLPFHYPEKTVSELLEQLRQQNPVSANLLLAQGTGQPLHSVQRLLGFVPKWMETMAMGHAKSFSLYSPAYQERFANRDAYRIFLNHVDVAGQLTGREKVHQSFYLWSKTILPNYMVRVLGDSAEMAHSIEGRMPFLDHPLVELVRRLPIATKIRGLTEKYVLREAARPFITDTIYRRQKHPFMAPPSTLKPNAPLHQLTQDVLRSSVLTSVPFYDQRAVIGLLDRLPALAESERAGLDSILMKILSACMLQERFGLT